MNSYEMYKYWLENDYFDKDIKLELIKIKNKPNQIEERFYKDLEFGTGGLRGIIGAGTNRMNIYTVRKASQGIANYLLKQGEEAKLRGIVIAYDSRNKSFEFALEAARTFTGNDIKVYLFDELKPTPELSFTVRYLGAIAGIVITASHNPKEYNGYKVYGEDGAQLTPLITKLVLDEINKISDITKINLKDKDTAVSNGLLKIIGNEIDDEYILKLKTLTISTNTIKDTADSMKIVYTPLHGTGNKLVRRILNETGFNNVLVVKNQEYPDINFTNANPSPNPEEANVYKHAIKLAKKEDAELIIATDPDCDRVGVMVKKSKGHYVLLSGNQVGALLMEYIFSLKKENSQLPQNAFAVKTIVTTELARIIANKYNIELIDVLTGFKYIGEKIRELNDFGDKKFILGIEDSCGYLAGTFVRDKDGVVTSMFIAEIAAYYKHIGMSLYDALQELYKKYGFYFGDMVSYTVHGKEGLDKIKNAMFHLRNNLNSVFPNISITFMRDYLERRRYDLGNYKIEDLQLPKSDVLYYEISDGSWFCIRPSGTEPKLKIYFETCDKDIKIAKEKLKKLRKKVLKSLKKIL